MAVTGEAGSAPRGTNLLLESCSDYAYSFDGNRGLRKDGVMTKREKLMVAALAYAVFSLHLAYSMVAPFFPLEASARNLSSSVIGFVFGAFHLIVTIMSPLYGCLISNIGAKFMYITGILICSVAIALFGLLNRSPIGAPYVILCFACRIVDANGTAMMDTAAFAMVTGRFRQQMSKIMGIMECLAGVGLMAGPPIGGLMYQIGGYQLPFFVAGGNLFIAGAFSFIIIPETDSIRPEQRSVIKILRAPNAILSFFLIFTTMFLVSFLDPTLTHYLISINSTISPAAIGGIFLVYPALYAASAVPTGWICNKGFVKSLLIIGFLASAAGLLLLGPSPLLPQFRATVWLCVVALAVLGVGHGICWLPAFQLTVDSVAASGNDDETSTHGVAAGMFTSGSALGSFAGSAAAGYMADTVGFPWAATLSAALATLTAVVTAISKAVDVRRLRRRREFESLSCSSEKVPLLTRGLAVAAYS